MNPLDEHVNARRWAYTILWVIGLILVACQVGVAAIPDAENPVWLTVALAVYPAIAAYVGYTAQQNWTPTARRSPREQ